MDQTLWYIIFTEIRINDEIRDHIEECLLYAHVTMGPKVKLFEDKFKQLFSYKYTVHYGLIKEVLCVFFPEPDKTSGYTKA